jgi:hypothetical protein
MLQCAVVSSSSTHTAMIAIVTTTITMCQQTREAVGQYILRNNAAFLKKLLQLFTEIEQSADTPNLRQDYPACCSTLDITDYMHTNKTFSVTLVSCLHAHTSIAVQRLATRAASHNTFCSVLSLCL